MRKRPQTPQVMKPIMAVGLGLCLNFSAVSAALAGSLVSDRGSTTIADFQQYMRAGQVLRYESFVGGDFFEGNIRIVSVGQGLTRGTFQDYGPRNQGCSGRINIEHLGRGRFVGRWLVEGASRDRTCKAIGYESLMNFTYDERNYVQAIDPPTKPETSDGTGAAF